MGRWSVRILVALLIGTITAGVSAQGFSDAAVAKAIERGKKLLWSTQQPDGSWKALADYKIGPTALAAYALLESGANPQDPRMAKALQCLANTKTKKTYTLGLRCQVWLSAMKHDKRYETPLFADMRTLLSSTKDGSYGYHSEAKGKSSGDNSNAQYGLLGVWAGALADMSIPKSFWKLVMKHWVSSQRPDGGWTYHGNGGSTNTMTAAGVASVYVCYDYLYFNRFVKTGQNAQFKPIDAGLAWFDKNFAKSVKGPPNYYYYYGVERVGLASGEKYFGATDWYKVGATKLIDAQAEDGSWSSRWGGKDIGTSFALLFLVRGRHPILFNKLRFEGDWNNRPRDLASLTWWISKTFETTINWQIINLAAPVREWHDAPILYISGSKAPKFTDEQIQKLRTYVLQGGTILSITEGKGTAFKMAMMKYYAKMFPEYKFATCDKDHDLYKVYFSLAGRPAFHVMSNGTRPLVIHTDEDMPLIWQIRNYRQNWAFEAAANIFMYVTDSGALRARGVNLWPEEPQYTPVRTVRVARLSHNAQFDPEPLAYQRLARMMASETQTKLEVLGPMDVQKLPESGAKVATLTGTGKFEYSMPQRDALKKWIQGGGTLVVDAAGGDRDFAKSAENLVNEMFAEKPGRRVLRKLALSSPLYDVKLGDLDLGIEKVKYRRKTVPRLGRENSKYPNLRAVLLDNRPAVIFSREDITVGLLGVPIYAADGYSSNSAYEIMRNILLFAGCPGN